LTRLCLANNKIGSPAERGVSKRCAIALSCLIGDVKHQSADKRHLNQLVLANNPLNDIIASALASSITWSSLNLLDLGFCQLKASYINVLLRGAQVSNCLKYLNLAFTSISRGNMETLVSWLEQEKCMLQDLDLSGNSTIGFKEAKRLAYGVAHNKSLTKLQVMGCGFGIKGCRSLLDALKHNQTLEELECDHKKCVFNPTIQDGTLEKLVYMSLSTTTEYKVVFEGAGSLPSLQARKLVKGPAPGLAYLPTADLERNPTLFQKVSLEYCTPGARCLVRLFPEDNDSPLFNAEVLETSSLSKSGENEGTESLIRLKLVDFDRPRKLNDPLPLSFSNSSEEEEETAICYCPDLDWKPSKASWRITVPYPVVHVNQLLTSRDDVAILALYQKAGPHTEWKPVLASCGNPEKVCFPLELLPVWIREEQKEGYMQSCEVVKRAINTAAFEASCFTGTLNQTSTHLKSMAGASSAKDSYVSLKCSEMRKCCSASQTDFDVCWPRKVFSPRPIVREVVVNKLRSVRPRVLPVEERSNIPEHPVLFFFYRKEGNSTTRFRMLSHQSVIPRDR